MAQTASTSLPAPTAPHPTSPTTSNIPGSESDVPRSIPTSASSSMPSVHTLPPTAQAGPSTAPPMSPSSHPPSTTPTGQTSHETKPNVDPGNPSTGPPPPAPLHTPPSIARPYCFFPLSNNPRHSQVREPEPIPDDLIVLPEDDPGATWGIPIFKPTYEEFKQFDEYVERVRPWGERSSIVKIIPPKEWVDAVELLDKRALSQLEIKSPIEQRLKGQNGVFMQLNVERNRNHPLSIHDWFQKCQSHADLRTPNPKEGDRSTNRDSKEAKARIAQRAAEAKAAKIERKAKAAKRKEEREARKAQKSAETPAPATGKPAGAEPSSSSLPPGDTPADTPVAHADDVPGLDSSSHTSHSSGEPLATTPVSNPATEQTIDPFYDEDWKKVWLPEGVEPEDFDVEGCSRIEHRFWKSLGTGKKDSWYGADLAGSIFADEEYPWNVAHLPNLLNRLPSRIPGVNSPYLYFGMWRAAFSWHVEDMDLYSINYIHFGAPKFWYAVPQIEADRFESLVRSYFPSDANGCDQFMRHKSCTVSPFKLHSEGIRVNKLVQHQNEFVITFPRGYHAGFNMGFNCAESVNFALPAWLELGRKAKACTCVDFSVRIDVDILTGAKQPTPEPEPPRRPETRKRKADDENGTAKRRRRPSTTEEPPQPAAAPPLKIVLRLPSPEKVVPISPSPKVAIVRETPPNPCVLCPSLSTEDLAPVFQPDDFIRSQSKTTAVQAHISCAIALPEAYTEEVTISDDAGNEEHVTYIKGLQNIDKARWKLKCACCVDKRPAKMGTKVQCTKGKCIRAFHVPCARNNDEVFYYAGSKAALLDPAKVTPADEAEFVVELLCASHNPAAVEIKKNKAAERLREKVLAIPQGSLVKYKSAGMSLAATHLEVNEEARKLLVRLPDLTVKEIAWSALDFRPSVQQPLENEYAGPPKRSRKEAEVRVAPYVDPRHYGLDPASVPPNPAEYYGAPQLYPPANAVRLVDAKLPPPREHGFPIPMVVDHMDRMRHLPPEMAYGPRVPLPPGRGFGFVHPPPQRAAPLGPLPLRMMSANGAPPPHNGPPAHGPPANGAPGNGWRPQRPHLPPLQTQLAGPPNGAGRIDLGLDRMMALMGKLPRMNVPALHIAGTNGKGSTSVLLESCLNAAGMRTARYNSPHLIEPRDAVRIDGQPVAADLYASAMAHVQRISNENNIGATLFEISTAVAFLIANTSQPPVDMMIIECGMGGLRDATNVIPSRLILASALTSVGLDHVAMLGDTIAKIAREKASICVNHGVLVVAPHLHPEALAAARAVAAERGTHLVEAQPSAAMEVPASLSLVPFRPPAPTVVRTPLPGAAEKMLTTHLALGGAHQLDNLSLALTILDVIRNDRRSRGMQPKIGQLSDAALQAGVQAARWQGRCEWLEWNDGGKSIPFLVDGAHNTDSAITLRRYLDSLNVPGPRTFIVSLSSSPGKTPDSVLGPLLRPGDRVAVASFTTPVESMPWVQCTEADTVRASAQPLVGPGEVCVVPGAGPPAVADALRWATKDTVGLTILCGSLYFVADAYRLLGAQ